jgi:hypothetical protein
LSNVHTRTCRHRSDYVTCRTAFPSRVDAIPTAEGKTEQAKQSLERYQEIDRAVYAELLAREREVFSAPAAAAVS